MEIIKRIFTIIIVALIAVFAFIYSYTSINKGAVVFADSTTDNWQNVTTNAELVEAFQYYCKSRDLTIEGSAADAVTSFTTTTFNNLCNGLGIDITALQANLKKETDGSNVRYLFDSTGITAYNRIFSQFLQDNDLEVGDSQPSGNNDILYSGVLFTDATGRVILCYSTSTSLTINGVFDINTELSDFYYGEKYKYNGAELYDDEIGSWTNSFTFPVYNSSGNYITRNFRKFDGKGVTAYTSSWAKTNARLYQLEENIDGIIVLNNGVVGIIYDSTNSNFYLCTVQNYTNPVYGDNHVYVLEKIYDNPNTSHNVVYITYNIQNVINNNNYEGDTIINNNGVPSEPSEPSEPDEPVELPNPEYTPAEDWDIDLPDLSIPNWILSGKENKFPFDIPFNVMYALSLLQATPEAPKVEGTLDFGFTTWDYDLDLSDFDDVAEICRDMEFLAFLTGLMLMTRKLIWG